MNGLGNLFNPKSVALIGASNRKNSVGSVVAKNLLRNGYNGIIMPVNPREEAIEGVLAYHSIHALPIVPDLAVICIPARAIPETIKELGKKGTKSAVIISAGLGADHGEGEKNSADLVKEYAKKYNMRIIGPNCVGIIVPPLKLNASFAHATPGKGDIAFLSQSGAVVTSVVDWACKKNIGFSHVVSMGDMLDVEFGSMLEYLADDDNNKSIVMYIEAIKDPDSFIKYASKVSKKKPIIVIKPGRHHEAAEAAASHTGAMVGSDAVYDAMFRRCGITRVYCLTELFDAVETITRGKRIHGNHLAILTNGGGIGVLATDSLIDVGGRLAKLEDKTIKKLDKFLPSTWSHSNPVDIIGDADKERYIKSFKVLLQDKNVDAICVMNCPVALASNTEIAEAIAKEYSSIKGKKPLLITSWLGAKVAQESHKIFENYNIPTYPSPTRAIHGFKHIMNYSLSTHHEHKFDYEKYKVDKKKAKSLINKALREKREWLTEPEAKEVFAAYGIIVTKSFEVKTPEQVFDAAKKIKEVVVLKINSPDITHKSDYGGVKLNINTAEEAKIAAENMKESFAKSHPKAKNVGFSVQQMIIKPKAFELILGVVEDLTFGPQILFGAGGKAVEVLNDKCLSMPPLNNSLAMNMIKSTKIYKLMKGYRDEKPVKFSDITDSLVRLSILVKDFPEIKELDINPLLVDHKSAIAVDGRILVRKK